MSIDTKLQGKNPSNRLTDVKTTATGELKADPAVITLLTAIRDALLTTTTTTTTTGA